MGIFGRKEKKPREDTMYDAVLEKVLKLDRVEPYKEFEYSPEMRTSRLEMLDYPTNLYIEIFENQHLYRRTDTPHTTLEFDYGEKDSQLKRGLIFELAGENKQSFSSRDSDQEITSMVNELYNAALRIEKILIGEEFKNLQKKIANVDEDLIGLIKSEG